MGKLEITKSFSFTALGTSQCSTTGSRDVGTWQGTITRPAAPLALVPSQDTVVQVRAQLALTHTQWTHGEKKNIFYLILQCFGVVCFSVSGRFETVLYFFSPLWEKVCLY